MSVKMSLEWVQYHTWVSKRIYSSESIHGVMVIIKGNGHGNTSSNPGWGWLLLT